MVLGVGVWVCARGWMMSGLGLLPLSLCSPLISPLPGNRSYTGELRQRRTFQSDLKISRGKSQMLFQQLCLYCLIWGEILRFSVLGKPQEWAPTVSTKGGEDRSKSKSKQSQRHDMWKREKTSPNLRTRPLIHASERRGAEPKQ